MNKSIPLHGGRPGRVLALVLLLLTVLVPAGRTGLAAEDEERAARKPVRRIAPEEPAPPAGEVPQLRPTHDPSSGNYLPEEGGRRAERASDYLRSRLDPETGLFDIEGLEAAWRHKESMSSSAQADGSVAATQQSVLGDAWNNIGPFSFVTTAGPWSGRIRAIAPVNGSEFYVGAALGGVWHTINQGAHWSPSSDFEKSLAMGSIAVDPDNPAIVYAGTGEYTDDGSNTGYGAGILKSTNGGASWTLFGASYFNRQRISKIVLDPVSIADPENKRVVYVTSTVGFFKSIDGGKSWVNLVPGNFSDAVVDPVDPDVVYAAKWGGGIYKYDAVLGQVTGPLTDNQGELPTSRFGRINLAATEDPNTHDTVLVASMQDYVAGNQLKGIWKTTDGGTNWTRIGGHPASFGDGAWALADGNESEPNDSQSSWDIVPIGDVIGGTLDSASDVDWYRFDPAYAESFTVEILANRANNGVALRMELYDASGVRHRDVTGGLPRPAGGDSKDGRISGFRLADSNYYLKISSADGSFGDYQLSVSGIDLGCQCNYDQVVAVEPDNPTVMYMGTVVLYRSTDGGANWEQIHDHGGANAIHTDVHTIAFPPGQPVGQADTLLVGTDGGIWESQDRGSTWINRNGDLSITQLYAGMAQHPTDPGFMVVGTQDNGSIRLQSGVWTRVAGADGGFAAIASTSTWYATEVKLRVRKTTDNAATQLVPKLKGLERAAAQFIAPMVMSPASSSVLIGGGGKGSQGPPEFAVYRTDNGAESWYANSGNLPGHRIISLAFAPSNASVYYAGNLVGRIYRTADAGASAWTEVTGTGIPGTRAIEALAVDPLNPNVVYVGVGQFANGNLFRTADASAATPVWVDIGRMAADPKDRLPDCPVNAIAVDPAYPNTIFVGTDVGLFRTVDGGSHWTTFDAGLPHTAVFDVVIKTTAGPGGRMRVGTHGRGVWDLVMSNDTCDQAIAATDGSYNGSTGGATQDGSSACEAGTTSRDVWYRYTATCDGELSVDTCGSAFDTVVSLHDPACPGTSATENVCNDDCTTSACPGPASCATKVVSQGETVLIRVSGYGGDAGKFTLNLSCDAPNDSCDGATQLSPGSIVAAGTRGAAWDNAPVCNQQDNTAPGVWYSVIGTGNTMTASLCNAPIGAYDTKLSVYCAGCATPQCITANDDACGVQAEASWCAAPGNVYTILVHGYQSQTGRFQLEISDDGTSCGPFYLNCNPGNDHCAASENLPITGITASNTDADTDGTATCAPTASDVWYDYTTHCYGFATFDTCNGTGSLEDTVLSIHDACGGNELGCSDDAPSACAFRRSRVTVTHRPDVNLKVRAASYSGAAPPEGTFDLDVDETLVQLAAPAPGLYASGGILSLAGHVFLIDSESYADTDLGSTGLGNLSALAWAPGLGLLYGIYDTIDVDQIVTVDPATGAASPFADLTYPSVRGLAYDPDAMVLYASELTTNTLLRIDPYSGKETTVGPLGFTGVEALAYDPATNVLYGSDIATNQLLIVDTGTGAASAVGPFALSPVRVEGLAFDSDRHILYGMDRYVGGGGRLLRIDTATGTATALRTYSSDFDPTGFTFVEGLPPATAGLAYDEKIPVSGGCPEYIVSNVSGLPAGLSAGPDGRIVGAASNPGRYTVTFDADDHDLATPAVIGASMPLIVRPGNDDAVHAFDAIDGTHTFDSTYATTDGPDEPVACNEFGYTHIEPDIWYCYSASCTGTLDATTCGSGFDSKMAVYDSCYVPGGDPPLACNDDSCGTQSAVSVPVTAGSQYLVRVGGYRGAKGGGQLNLTCSGDPGGACCLPSSCIYTGSGDCAARGGAFQGAGSDCSVDGDGDGISDACDSCPSDSRKTAPGACGCGVPDRDLDGDGIPDCLDDDDDGDGWADVVDCDSENPDTYPDAPEVNDGLDNQCPNDRGSGLVDEISGSSGFHNPSDKNEFSWTVQRYAATYEAARSESPQFAACTLLQTPANSWSDPAVPAAGVAWYYLVRSYAPYSGSWGQDHDGVERSSICP